MPFLFEFCTPAGARTLDTLIKSQVLYQLSYGCILLVLRVQRYAFFLLSANFGSTFLLDALIFFVDLTHYMPMNY